MYDTVLVPTDGSLGAQRGAKYGLDLAVTYDATVHVIHVIDESRFDTPALGSVELAFERCEREGEAAIDEVVEAARRRGLDVERACVRGTPYRAILSYAEAHDVDIVVMGRRGVHGRESPQLGSTTNRVLRAGTVPVMPV